MEDGNWQAQAFALAALAPKHVLFLCVQNSARSQIAEGLARHLAAGNIRISSAGSKPAVVRPEAIEVLNEMGVDSGMLRAKGLDAVDMDSVEAVITLCADEICPFFPRPVTQVHWALPDPASVEGAGRLDAFRAVRDELMTRLRIVFGVGKE
ncbi:MAG: arsenate reductase ArsC [Deltaproteobacteria bacterium]|nr:arsenate reductase ArsC [Deltaproteobacteria bacterium]